MKKIFIILPLFNDWKSANKLLKKIDLYLKKKFITNIIIVNDYSSEKISIKKKKFFSIKKIKVINLKRNVGSQKAIFIGLQYIRRKKINSTVTIMDSDGEDDPNKVVELINLSSKYKKYIVVAERSKRTENVFYKFLNYLRLFLTFVVTGKYLNFGNFSSLHSSILKKILNNSNLAMAYSAGIAKNFKNFKSYPIKKRRRFFGVSKVSFNFLLEHSLNIITVFKKFFRKKSFTLNKIL